MIKMGWELFKEVVLGNPTLRFLVVATLVIAGIVEILKRHFDK